MSSDLRSLLNDKAGPVTASLEAGSPSGMTSSPVAVSDTVLELDRWGLRRGTDLAAEWEAAGTGEVDAALVADAHGVLFEPAPELAAKPRDAHRAAWFKQLMETPEYASLHRQTLLDAGLAAEAARGLCEEYERYAANNPAPPAEQPGQPGTQPGGDGESIQGQLARIRSTGRALVKAQDDVNGITDTAEGIGMGMGPGQHLDAKALAAAFKRVRNSSLLRKVMELAGRMRARCRTLQRQKLDAKRGEITGIELGGQISRLIPRERLALAGGMGPELQDRAEYRLLKRSALCYRQKLNTPVAGGPIVVSVDESGSMSGEKIIAAKALALTLAWLAGQQKRWIALVGFAGGTEGRALALPPGHSSSDQLLKWVEEFFGGGTTLDCPCGTVPTTFWREWLGQGMQRGKVDHIIITDGELDCPAELHDTYAAFATAEKVKTYGIVVGCHSAGGLETVCDKTWCLPALDLDAAAVEEVLSL